MKKTLVIMAHPNIEDSLANKAWRDAIKQHEDSVTFHDLYQTYPDGHIDITKEQALVDEHNALIFQFPMYWFSAPPLLKQWFDEVLEYGWAYGENGTHLQHKNVALAVSTGVQGHEFSVEGRCGISLENLLMPFELSMRYCQADYRSIFSVHGINNEPNATTLTEEEIAESANNYVDFVLNL